eukprot:scaffold191456_cov25-Tisochrysis_lutea.AAC.2
MERKRGEAAQIDTAATAPLLQHAAIDRRSFAPASPGQARSAAVAAVVGGAAEAAGPESAPGGAPTVAVGQGAAPGTSAAEAHSWMGQRAVALAADAIAAAAASVGTESH